MRLLARNLRLSRWLCVFMLLVFSPLAGAADGSQAGARAAARPAIARPRWAKGAVLAMDFEKVTAGADEQPSTVPDLSRSGSDGTLCAAGALTPKPVTGRVGHALWFRDRAMVVTRLGSDPTLSWTVAAWVFPDKPAAGPKGRANVGHAIVESRTGAADGIAVGLTASEIRVVYYGVCIAERNFPCDFATPGWRHIVVVCDRKAGTVTAWVDGKQVGRRRVEFAAGGAMGNRFVHLGYKPGPPNLPFQGALDEVAMWTRALSDREVATLCDYTQPARGYCAQIARVAEERPMPKYNGHFYRLIPETVSWYIADERCGRLRGTLACAGTQKENEFLATLALGRRVWLGGTDRGTEGNWQWVTAEQFKYASWAPGEPDGKRGREDYLQTNAGRKGAWCAAPAAPPGRTSACAAFPPDERVAVGFLCEWEIIYGTYDVFLPNLRERIVLASNGKFTLVHRAPKYEWDFRDGVLTLHWAPGRDYRFNMIDSRSFANDQGGRLVFRER